MRAWELYEYKEDSREGGGWFNINTNEWVSTIGYHTLTVFHKMDKFGLTPEKMKTIPAFAKWFDLDWGEINDTDDPGEIATWWMDIDPYNEVPTLSGKLVYSNKDRSEYLLDGDLEIIDWMNNQGWVRVINSKQFTDQDLSIQGKDLKQIVKTARFFDKHDNIESLYFDTNNFKNSEELSGDKLRHFLRYGNLNFGVGVLESKTINLTSHDKLWVDTTKGNIIEVPISVHHTYFAYQHPDKFGLSGNIFKNHEYQIDPETDKPALFDTDIGAVMFNAGWVRANMFGDEANVHSLDLKQCAKALRILKKAYNDMNSAVIDIGADITPNETYSLENNEFGKGSLRTFLRTGKLPVDEDLKARDVIGSAVRADEIPQKYREKYEMIGRGATSLVYAMDKDWVLVFTRDKMKEEWLGYMGLELGEYVDQLEVRGIHRIQGMDEIPIYVIKMPRLYDLSPQNKTLVKQEVEQFNDIWQEMQQKYMYNKDNRALIDLYQYYGEHLEDSLIYPLLDFVANYDISQFFFDLLNRNFMQDAQGNIVIVDPIVDSEIFDLIMDSKK